MDSFTFAVDQNVSTHRADHRNLRPIFLQVDRKLFPSGSAIAGHIDFSRWIGFMFCCNDGLGIFRLPIDRAVIPVPTVISELLPLLAVACPPRRPV